MKTYNILDLYSKPASYIFSDDEVEFIKKHISKSHFEVRYALYRFNSSKNSYIAFIIDSMKGATRRSAAENQWETICTRNLTNIEYNEIIQNFGTNHRRFKVWYYRDIEALIEDDLKYNLHTPEAFIKICKEKGYSKAKHNHQLSLTFN